MIAQSKKTGLRENFLRPLKILRYLKRADVLIGIEFLLLLVLYAIFMFSDKVPLAGLAALALLWLVRWWVTGRLGVATPLDAPILGILALIPVSLYASADWSLSLPKVYGILLGVAIFYAVVNAFDTLSRLQFAPFILILLSLVVTAIGMVGTDWFNDKIISLPQVYGFLPRLIRGVPRSVTGGIHPNIFGGALTFLVPLLASLLWEDGAFKRIRFADHPRFPAILRAGYFFILFFSFVIVTFALLLTQSRGSMLGVAVGLFALALWHDRRFLWVIPLAALGFFGAVQVLGAGSLSEFISRIDVAGGSTLPGRLEIWQRAIYMIRDFPFTGIGIGTFDPVAHALYPFILFANATIPHAHNMLLEVAVDLGIPGLVFYAALLSGFAFSAWKASQVYRGSLHALIVGLACGMLAHQVFGIMDAYMLGTKLGVVMWVFMGLAAALYLHRDQYTMQLFGYSTGDSANGNSGLDSAGRDGQVTSSKLSDRLGRVLRVYAGWAIFSLLAIAFIGEQPILGLGIALIGGGILGYICVALFESKTASERMG